MASCTRSLDIIPVVGKATTTVHVSFARLRRLGAPCHAPARSCFTSKLKAPADNNRKLHSVCHRAWCTQNACLCAPLKLYMTSSMNTDKKHTFVWADLSAMQFRAKVGRCLPESPESGRSRPDAGRTRRVRPVVPQVRSQNSPKVGRLRPRSTRLRRLGPGSAKFERV